MQYYERLCLFAHYDSTNSVADHVLYYLDALQKCGFSTVVISNCTLRQEEIGKLARCSLAVIIRQGGGRDFASWAAALACYRPTASGVLLLTNDSVYGPIGDLGESLSRLLATPADVYGMVESTMHGAHLQSWFLLLLPAAHQHNAFEQFMGCDFTSMPKAALISKGEIGFSMMCQSVGLRLHALHRYNAATPLGMVAAVNPMYGMSWQELICLDHIPFIKVHLLRCNPRELPHLDIWRTIVSERAPRLVPMIEAHVRRETHVAIGPIPHHHLNPMPWSASACLMRQDNASRHGSAAIALIWACMAGIGVIGGTMARPLTFGLYGRKAAGAKSFMGAVALLYTCGKSSLMRIMK